MHSTKAVQVLQAFSPEEMKKFRDFINSPYHNTNKSVIKLFEALRKEYPEFDEKKISKEKLYPKIFGSKPYNEQVMKNLSSELLGLELKFLTVDKYLTQNYYDQEVDLLSQLRVKKLDAVFNKKWKELEKELADSTLMIHPLFYHLHRIETEKTKFHIARDEQRLIAGKVLKTGEYLIYYFLTEISRITIDMHSNVHSFNVVYDNDLVHKFIGSFNFDAVIQHINENDYEYKDMLTLYYYRLMAVLYDKDDDYYTFKDLLYKHLHMFSDPEKASLLLSLEQCSIHRSNLGKVAALQDQLDAMKKQVELGIFRTIRKELSLMNFRNIIHVSLMLREVEWTEKFLHDHIDMVNPLNKENVLNHSLAVIAYKRDEFEKSLEHFNIISLENPFYASDVKTHQAIIFYELGHYDSALSTLDSFRHILNRTDFVQLFREVNIRFINFLTSMIKLKFKEQDMTKEEMSEAASKLLEKFQNTTEMTNHKNWISKKIKEMVSGEELVKAV